MAVIATSDSEAEPNEPSHIPHKRTANNGTLSPGASSTASDSPTPTNSVKERKEAWSNVWQGLGIYFKKLFSAQLINFSLFSRK
jgi:hypothetical protein